jgi:CRISPR/Cas system CSM-associated protein Csm2 small subunit
MHHWQKVLVDIGVLAFFALLYYLYQKNRIIYYSEKEFFQELESFIENLQQFLDNNQNMKDIEKYQDFLNSLAAFHNRLPKKEDLLIEVPENFPKEFKDHFEHLKGLLDN